MKPRRKSSRKSPEIDDQGKEDDKLQTKESASKDESKKRRLIQRKNPMILRISKVQT